MSEALSFQASVRSMKSPRYHLDAPVADLSPFSFPVGQEVIVAGWAFLEAHVPTTPPISLEIVSRRTGVPTSFTAQRTSRPDVAAHFGEQVLMSGFTCSI